MRPDHENPAVRAVRGRTPRPGVRPGRARMRGSRREIVREDRGAPGPGQHVQQHSGGRPVQDGERELSRLHDDRGPRLGLTDRNPEEPVGVGGPTPLDEVLGTDPEGIELRAQFGDRLAREDLCGPCCAVRDVEIGVADTVSVDGQEVVEAADAVDREQFGVCRGNGDAALLHRRRRRGGWGQRAMRRDSSGVSLMWVLLCLCETVDSARRLRTDPQDDEARISMIFSASSSRPASRPPLRICSSVSEGAIEKISWMPSKLGMSSMPRNHLTA